VKIRQDNIIFKYVTPIYRKFRHFRRRYDTIRHIDIESIFRYFRYIEAPLKSTWLTFRTCMIYWCTGFQFLKPVGNRLVQDFWRHIRP